MAASAPRVLMFDALCVVPYYTGYLCKALQDEGVAVTLASVTYYLDPGWFQRMGISNRAAFDGPRWFCPTHPLTRRIWKFTEYLFNLTFCALGLIFRRPGVLHVQFFELILHRLPFEVWFLLLARRLRIPIVYTAHDLVPHDGEPANLETLRRVYHLADALIAHDAIAAQALRRDFGVPAGKIFMIPHGPLFEEPPGTRDQERRRLGAGNETCVVLWQGILRSYKGVPFLLDAWRQVTNHKPQALLRIAGPGTPDLIGEVRQKVASLGLEETVRLDLRFLSVQELRDAFEAADVLVYPYREITTSGALMTGINYGKALVATRLPAFEEILTGEDNALLVPYGAASELAAALTRLIEDRSLRERLGQSLRRRNGQQTRWPEIARRTLDCYQAVAHGQQ